MIEGLKPYESYRPSVLKWVDCCPSHWKDIRVDRLFFQRDEPPQPYDERVTGYLSGRVTLRSNMAAQKIKGVIKDGGWKRIHPGDFAISGMNAHLGGMGVSDAMGKCSPIYLVLIPRSETNAHFVAYALRHVAHVGALKSFVSTIRFNSADFRRDALKLFLLPMPGADEQAAIVRFLDHANRRIDRFIRAKKKLIALLNEQKQAIIHRAVTRGLDPSVPMKDSGVPWLGEIPAHWEVRRVKQVARITRGKFSYRPRNDPSLYGGPYPFIQTGAVARANRIINTHTQTLNERGLAVSRLFAQGTLVMTIAANIGDVAILGFDACFPDSIVGFSPMRTALRDYLYLLFRTMKSEWLREAPVNTQGNLNVERIGAMPLPLPPLAEQDFIVRHVSDGTLPLDAAIDHAVREIAHIREYRTRLIADLVTGQLDVREAVKGLPVEEADGGETVDAGDEIDEAEIGDIDQDEAA